jgi:hypothetical protein
MPAGALSAIAVGVIGWASASREPDHLFLGFVVGNVFLYLFALVGGMVFGNTGPNDANYAMGQFLATRPISDTELARAILRTASKSIYLTIAIWAAAFLFVCGSLAAIGATNAMQLPDDDPYWGLRLLFTLVAPWALMSTILCVGLSGYGKHMVIVGCGVLGVLVAGMLASRYFLTDDVQRLLGRLTASVVAISLLGGTTWIYVSSRRRGLIQPGTVWAAAIAWSAATLTSVAMWPAALNPGLLGYVFAAAGFALLIAPFAAAPLALSINRHR